MEQHQQPVWSPGFGTLVLRCQNPGSVAALCTLGFALETLGDEEGARACSERVLLLQLDSPVARVVRCSHLLRAGNFTDGWRDYEERWRVRQYCGTPRDLTRPRWHGERVHGLRIYIRRAGIR
jgi:hypothetical protein